MLTAAMAAVAVAAVPATSMAYPNDVELTSVFAEPIEALPFGTDLTNTTEQDENAQSLCTPEPAGQNIYGTQDSANWATEVAGGNLNSGNGIGAGYPASTASSVDNPSGYAASGSYSPAQFPSRDNLTPALQAGASNDLCFGFTLTPDVQNDPAVTAANPTDAVGSPAVNTRKWKDLIRSPNNGTGKRLQNDPPVPIVDSTRVSIDSSGNAIDNDDLKDVSINLPDGFLGDPDSGDQCSASDFGSGNYLAANCPLDTQVGTVFARVTTMIQTKTNPQLLHLAIGGSPNTGIDAPGGSNFSAGGQVYNLQHTANELGLLGVSIQPVAGVAPVKLLIRLRLDPDGSGRVQTVVTDIPRNLYQGTQVDASGQLISGATALPMYVESIGIRAWGKASEHDTAQHPVTHDFAEWGTDCSTPLSASVSADTYLGVESSMTSSPFQLTGCSDLKFLPSINIQTAQHTPSTPTGATITLSLAQAAAGDPGTALLKDASVTLPPGLEIGAQAGTKVGGLRTCTAAQFGANNTDADTCPDGSVAGTVTIVSPLQSRQFVGKVFLGEQPAVGQLPALYLEASPSGATAADAPRIKLVGKVTTDANGQVTTTFTDAPQLRFSTLQIQFPDGPDALFTTPRTCGTPSADSTFTSSGGQTATATSNGLDISQGCDTPSFAPTFSMSTANTTVGASSPTTISIGRADGSPWLSGISVALPSGFLSDLTKATECPAAQAAAGTCDDSSRIATVTTQAGDGAQPLTLTGSMYLAERQPGFVAGAVIVVPAKIGDIDLGNVVVPATISLRPTDAGLTLDTTVPTRFDNIALNLRSVSVSLDRPNFPLNPTSCGALPAVGSFTGDGGQAASVTSNVTFTGCASQPFKPTLTASLSGDTKPLGHPQVNIGITTRPGDANLKSTTVVLPAGVSSDLTNLQSSCAIDAFNSGTCPAANRIGSASARVSITNDTITGDVYLVHIAGQTLPGIGLSFTGRYTQRLLSQVKISNTRLVTEFDAIPDLPLQSLSLTINGGAADPIRLGPACTADSTWDVTFGGQGGQSASQNIAYPCATIPVPTPTLKWSKKSGISLAITPPAGKTLKSAKLTLPSGFTFKTTKSGKKNLKVTLTGGKGKVKFSKSALTVTGTGAGPTKITVTLKPKGYTVSKKLAKSFKKGKKLKLKVRVGASNGQVYSKTTSVKVAK